MWTMIILILEGSRKNPSTFRQLCQVGAGRSVTKMGLGCLYESNPDNRTKNAVKSEWEPRYTKAFIESQGD